MKKRKRVRDDAAAPATCAICLGALPAPSCLARLNGCDHTWHLACISEWTKVSDACPLCKREATEILVNGRVQAKVTKPAPAGGDESEDEAAAWALAAEEGEEDLLSDVEQYASDDGFVCSDNDVEFYESNDYNDEPAAPRSSRRRNARTAVDGRLARFRAMLHGGARASIFSPTSPAGAASQLEDIDDSQLPEDGGAASQPEDIDDSQLLPAVPSPYDAQLLPRPRRRHRPVITFSSDDESDDDGAAPIPARRRTPDSPGDSDADDRGSSSSTSAGRDDADSDAGDSRYRGSSAAFDDADSDVDDSRYRGSSAVLSDDDETQPLDSVAVAALSSDDDETQPLDSVDVDDDETQPLSPLPPDLNRWAYVPR